jgi:hypothetical protein
MRSRTQCEAEILQAYHAYHEAVDQGDQLGADTEELVINQLLDEYSSIPLQRPHT